MHIGSTRGQILRVVRVPHRSTHSKKKGKRTHHMSLLQQPLSAEAAKAAALRRKDAAAAKAPLTLMVPGTTATATFGGESYISVSPKTVNEIGGNNKLVADETLVASLEDETPVLPTVSRPPPPCPACCKAALRVWCSTEHTHVHKSFSFSLLFPPFPLFFFFLVCFSLRIRSASCAAHLVRALGTLLVPFAEYWVGMYTALVDLFLGVWRCRAPDETVTLVFEIFFPSLALSF